MKIKRKPENRFLEKMVDNAEPVLVCVGAAFAVTVLTLLVSMIYKLGKATPDEMFALIVISLFIGFGAGCIFSLKSWRRQRGRTDDSTSD